MVGKLIASDVAGGLAKNKATPYVIGGVVIVSLGLVYFGVARPLLCHFNVFTNCKKHRKEKGLLKLNAFNPSLANPKNISITHDRAKKLAEQIEDALGYTMNPVSWFDDNEEALYGALQSAGSIYNVSLISRMYEAKYGESLSGRLMSKLNTEEIEKVELIIKNFKR